MGAHKMVYRQKMNKYRMLAISGITINTVWCVGIVRIREKRRQFLAGQQSRHKTEFNDLDGY